MQLAHASFDSGRPPFSVTKNFGVGFPICGHTLHFLPLIFSPVVARVETFFVRYWNYFRYASQNLKMTETSLRCSKGRYFYYHAVIDRLTSPALLVSLTHCNVEYRKICSWSRGVFLSLSFVSHISRRMSSFTILCHAVSDKNDTLSVPLPSMVLRQWRLSVNPHALSMRLQRA
ncbi:hypothetical protein F5I97DRAFT_439300 [Phlebopus sp. FC_14]|nr:hypothetical protein F5I97DRAFT_439300 [Phlebopus sp. FC_14]